MMLMVEGDIALAFSGIKPAYPLFMFTLGVKKPFVAFVELLFCLYFILIRYNDRKT